VPTNQRLTDYVYTTNSFAEAYIIHAIEKKTFNINQIRWEYINITRINVEKKNMKSDKR